MHRMNFDHFIDKVLWAMMIAIGGYGASKIEAATSSINDLNSKMSVIIEKIAYQSKYVEDHESRIRNLERKK
jgi:hypothetical protein